MAYRDTWYHLLTILKRLRVLRSGLQCFCRLYDETHEQIKLQISISHVLAIGIASVMNVSVNILFYSDFCAVLSRNQLTVLIATGNCACMALLASSVTILFIAFTVQRSFHEDILFTHICAHTYRKCGMLIQKNSLHIRLVGQ